jgi:transposase
MFAALTDSAGVTAHRPGALERVQLLLEDWQHAHGRLVDTETRMTAVLDELGLTRLATSIPGLSAVGAAAILAETGDPRRFATARALVKHAGLAPREKTSGAFTGRTKLTGQGRPRLRLVRTGARVRRRHRAYRRPPEPPEHTRARDRAVPRDVGAVGRHRHRRDPR